MKIIKEKANKERLESLGVEKWGKWECGVSNFPWEYSSDERCYILEGEAEIEGEGEKVRIEKGDIVLFKKGLCCQWNILSPIRKVYRFE
ncbi:DUF861 domain-containing protein [bacterium]|nr:DUF861 domain-containing protein [bacterium]MBU1600267.1 DUF861 domain-containing protein [bacterium]MBU2462157.1 DUF861 domain-containing protein [bacterium]